MTKIRDIVAATGRVFDVLTTGTHLREAIQKIDETYDAVVLAAAREGQQHGENYNKLVQAIDNAAQVIDSLEIDEVFGDIRELRGQLDGAGQYAPVMTGAAQEHLLENIAHFNSALKGFVKRRQRQDAMLTAKAAHDLYALMSMTESMFQTYRELLDDTVELAEGQDKLELTFGSEPTAPNVGSL